MVNINSVVNYLLEKSGFSLTNLKIQKLLYYVYGVCLAATDKGRPFDEQPEAWQYGPVFPSVYHDLKIYGSQHVRHKILGAVDLANQVVKNIVDAVYEFFGDLSEAVLIRSTHKPAAPWASVYKRGTRRATIPDETIKQYFQEHVIKKD